MADMRQVSKDILDLHLTSDMTMDAMFDKFYELMTKHGITQGKITTRGEGVEVDNYEWVMALNLFETMVHKAFIWKDLRGVPEHLRSFY